MSKNVKFSASPDFSQTLTSLLLGQAVRAKRTQSNLKISDAAALCGVAKQTLSNIENGHVTTQFSSILQVCAGLGIKLYIQPWSGNEDTANEWQ